MYYVFGMLIETCPVLYPCACWWAVHVQWWTALTCIVALVIGVLVGGTYFPIGNYIIQFVSLMIG